MNSNSAESFDSSRCMLENQLDHQTLDKIYGSIHLKLPNIYIYRERVNLILERH